MKVQEPPYPGYRDQGTAPTRDYRVVFWEKQLPPSEGWSELTLDVADVNEVHEAIAWAEATIDKQLDQNRSPDQPHGERIYCLYAKVPGEDWFVHIAGWNPVIAPGNAAQSLGNLPLRRTR
jgi:hypothetical protein